MEQLSQYYFIIRYSISLTIFITAISAEVIVRKSFNQSIQLDCPACNSNECPISINDVSTTPTASAGYSIQNNQLIVPPRDRDSYGRICCGAMDRQRSCYTVCPYTGHLTEICDSCLTLSVNVTAAVVGDAILVISSIRQRPHNGITLFINGVASTDPSADLSCSTKSGVLGHQVIYHCIAKKSGTVTLKTNTEFCETVLNSQQIDITIEEQKIMPNETLSEHVPSTILSDDIDPTSVVIPITNITTATTTVIVSNDSTSALAFNTTAAIRPTEPSRATADNFDLSVGLIVVIVIVLLLILVVVIMILVVICRIRKWNAKRCDTPPLEFLDQQLQEVHPPVSVEDSEIGSSSIDTENGDYLLHNSRPASELTSQLPHPCDQSHVVQQ